MLNPYDVTKTGEFFYTFTTNGGANYELVFLKSKVFKDSMPVYAFNISRDRQKIESDADRLRVRDTVIFVLSEFFKNTDNAIVTICDSTDGRQDTREHLFDMWYKSFGRKYRILQEKITTPEEYGKIQMALYYHEANMFRTFIEGNIKSNTLFQ